MLSMFIPLKIPKLPHRKIKSLTEFINYLKAARDILFPCLCLHCEKKILQGYLCRECLEKIVFLYPLRCRYCAKPLLNTSNVCKQCSGKIYPYQELISATAYKEPIVSLIHLFKYRNYDYLADYLASLMIKCLSKASFNPHNYHFITPVPLHRDKLKIRGYNQAKLLAKLLSNHFKISFRDDIIINTDIRPSQTKLSVEKRKKNIQGIFTATKDLTDKRIILIDDIFTTGSTVNACSKALGERRAENITVITLSKTEREVVSNK